jgi:hypothetical protein
MVVPILVVVAVTLVMPTVVLALPPDAPIPGSQLRGLLGAKGMDVDFIKYTSQEPAYAIHKRLCLKTHGFSHVRLRTDLDISGSWALYVDRVINDTLAVGLVPILAKKGDAYKANPTNANLQAFLDWWHAAAVRYASHSHRLLFDIMIEPGDALGKDWSQLNNMYASAFRVIRESNPTRLLSIAPGVRSCPYFADKLKVPTQAGKYWFMEWHAFASGPQRRPPQDCQGWKDDSASKDNFEQMVQLARKFVAENNNPGGDWYGAVRWVTHDGVPSTLQGQLDFVKFIMDTASSKHVSVAWISYAEAWGVNSTCTFVSSNAEQIVGLLSKY